MADRSAPAEDPQAHPSDRLAGGGGLRHHDRQRPPQPAADDAHLRHERILGDRPLDLGGRHFLAAGEHDRVDAAARDPHVAVGIDRREVSRREERIGVVRDVFCTLRIGRLGFAVRRQEHAEAAAGRPHEQLPVVVDSEFDSFERKPDRPRSRRPRAREGHDGAGLRETVALHERHAGIVERADRPLAERRAARHAHSHAAPERRGEVADRTAADRSLEPLEHRRHAEDRGRLRLATGVEQLSAILDDREAGSPHDRRAEVARPRQRVAHGQPREPHVPLVIQEHGRRRDRVGQQRPL